MRDIKSGSQPPMPSNLRCSCQLSGNPYTTFVSVISGGVFPCITATIILESSGNFSLRNPLHKFIDFAIQTAHNIGKLPFEQLPCTLLYKLLQCFHGEKRRIWLYCAVCFCNSLLSKVLHKSRCIKVADLCIAENFQRFLFKHTLLRGYVVLY